MFNFLRPKAEPKAPQQLRVPHKQFDALVGGAMAAMSELEDIAAHAKSRLREHERPIVQADLEELLRMLADAKQRIDAEIDADVAKSTDSEDTEWEDAAYNVVVVPTIQMANSPQAIIDLTLAAADNGAKSAKLLYDLMVAEMDVAVARYYVTMNTGFSVVQMRARTRRSRDASAKPRGGA
jgi:hypothetical protein